MFILQNDKTTKRQNVRNVKNKSFTLLEIVFTITIIGILLAICLPAMSAIKLNAQKLKDQSNLQTISAAWREAAINRGWIFDGIGDNGRIKASAFVYQLAGRYRSSLSDIILNDPYVYISPNDRYASKILKTAICYMSSKTVDRTAAFSDVTNLIINNSWMFSYCFALNLPSNVPLDTTPLAFTRGLQIDGKWDEKCGLYGSKGGYVVFCDGHTVWFDGSRPAKFLKWDKTGYTSDIRKAFPGGIWITCGDYGTYIKDVPFLFSSDGQPDHTIILFDKGTGDN
ncbi:MAG: type II secretion system GspH family protein [Puniceicoccales bacterium]|jgi:type II secretory pathway pseudopilin PulG|nr:type II secretion system GspH family protein [Puniceicoccales bacterium]